MKHTSMHMNAQVFRPPLTFGEAVNKADMGAPGVFTISLASIVVRYV